MFVPVTRPSCSEIPPECNVECLMQGLSTVAGSIPVVFCALYYLYSLLGLLQSVLLRHDL